LCPTALGRPQAVISKEELRERNERRNDDALVVELRSYLRSDLLIGQKLFPYFLF